MNANQLKKPNSVLREINIPKILKEIWGLDQKPHETISLPSVFILLKNGFGFINTFR